MDFLYSEELIYFLIRIFAIVITVFMIKMVIRILYYDGISFNKDKDTDNHENKVDLKKKDNDDIGIYLN